MEIATLRRNSEGQGNQAIIGPQTELKRMQSRKAIFRGMMDYKNEMEIGIRNNLQHKNAKGTFTKIMFLDTLDKGNITGVTNLTFCGTFKRIHAKK